MTTSLQPIADIRAIPARIMLSTAEGIYFFRPEEIVRLEAESNYTRIHFADKSRMLTSKVLKTYAPMLEPHGFIRTHRTHLVNRKYIAHIRPDGTIVMSDNSIAEVSRRMRSSVMRLLRAA